MPNPENTYQKGRVVGLVSYLNERNQRVGVPQGMCELSDNDGYGPIYLRWNSGDDLNEIELTPIEFSTYLNTKDLVLIND